MSDRNVSGSLGVESHLRIGFGTDESRVSSKGGGLLVNDQIVPNGLVPGDLALALPIQSYTLSGVISGASRFVSARTIIPRSGFLRDFTIAVGVQSGNIELGVYDTGDALAGSRSKIGASSGALACPAVLSAAKPVVTWDPGAGAIPVRAGQVVDFALAIDNTTATFYRSVPNIGVMPDNFMVVPGGALPKLGGVVVSGMPMPATVAEASWLGSATIPFIAARVSST